MTYAVSKSLQTAVYDALTQDAGVTALVGSHIYDELPSGAVPPLFLVIGTEDVRDRSDKTGNLARHLLSVSVVSHSEGFAKCKALAGAVSDALIGTKPSLSRGHLISLTFGRAKARRTRGQSTRRIDLTFSALVADD